MERNDNSKKGNEQEYDSTKKELDSDQAMDEQKQDQSDPKKKEHDKQADKIGKF